MRLQRIPLHCIVNREVLAHGFSLIYPLARTLVRLLDLSSLEPERESVARSKELSFRLMYVYKKVNIICHGRVTQNVVDTFVLRRQF